MWREDGTDVLAKPSSSDEGSSPSELSLPSSDPDPEFGDEGDKVGEGSSSSGEWVSETRRVWWEDEPGVSRDAVDRSELMNEEG